ncbi:MAG: GNAT family N-acetyltransferase [Saprospiraceae bacterium]|nr:GNAT family N-acetyltransferase [Saprospiraceae bacterium]
MEQYVCKKITQENLADVGFLVKTVTKKTLSEPYYHKKFNSPKSGGQYHGWVAYETTDSTPVAVVGALPFTAVWPNGDLVTCAMIMETFTLPSHSGRGLMTWLLEKTMVSLKLEGIPLIFTIPNQNSEHVFVKKFGFTNVGTMEYYEVPLTVFPLEALCRKLRVPGIFKGWAELVLTPYLAPPNFVLENSVQLEGFGGLLHDKQFYAYKSFSFNRLCRFSRIDCWLKFENGLLVGDVLLPENCSDAQFDAWLLQLKKIARLTGLRKILFNTFPGSRLSKKMSARYTAQPSWAVCCKTEDAACLPLLEKMRFGYGDFDTF